MGLFHEIGHAQNDTKTELTAEQKIREELAKLEGDRNYEVLLNEDLAKILSKSERWAWAWTLKTLKNFKKEWEIDIYSLFPNFSDLKQYIDNNLATY